MVEKLFDFIDKSPTAFHAAETCAERLFKAGYTELFESDAFYIERGGKYFVRRGGSSLIAFSISKGEAGSFMISAAHSDSPAFKIRESGEIPGEFGIRLSVERYGGMIPYTWFDRPLSIAGRVMVKNADGAEMRLVNFEKMCAVIPSVAPHINKEGAAKFDPARDMIPLFRMGESESFSVQLAKKLGCDEGDILSSDLYLYNPQHGQLANGFAVAPRLDDLQCAFATLEAFISAKEGKSIPVFCLFDNEEVGSTTSKGADSTFLCDILDRICTALKSELGRMLSCSMMLSCDNAHAAHPNHPELSDPNNKVYLNGGVVIKFNGNQKYTSDAISAGLFRLICEKADVPTQTYVNRADILGGSTLGNISNAHVSLISVDIGAPQLAMHSALETAGEKDIEYLIAAVRCFFESSIAVDNNNYKII